MKAALILALTLLIPASFLLAQDRGEMRVERIEEKVDIDGKLEEPFWANAQTVSDFIQNGPVTGEPSKRKTEVKMAYDNNAVYIGAVLYDERDSMSLTLSQRDDFGNADWFGVVFDPYNSGTIGFAFLVTSAGVQIDELHQVSNVDNNWNAVWKSEVTVLDDRWVAEIRIPFSAIRFPENTDLDWGVNFARNIRRYREQSHWNFYDPRGINLISQLGVMKGIKNIDSPLRLSFTPYVSGYIENYDGSTGRSLNGGMDVKYGLNDAFTLDMTLIPDFGQVQFDNQVLNLSPFEVQFNENRQFFTEGTELFNKQGIFYSRRVGGTPINSGSVNGTLDSNEVVSENPQTSQLLNATKLSGRTKKGLGIGVFNAITATINAVTLDTVTDISREIETGPLTNYNVFVLDQNLKNNSSITVTNTNVLRNGETYDANVTAAGADIYTKNQKYFFSANGILSQHYQSGGTELGYKTNAVFSKATGNFLYRFAYNESNKTYDQNDLGFQLNNNKRNYFARFSYNIYKPFWRLYRMWSSVTFNYGELVDPNAFSDFSINTSLNGTFRNYMSSGVWLNSTPVKNHNWFEPRVTGRYYEEDQAVNFGGFMSSDYSKPFALDINCSYWNYYNEDNRYDIDLRISPRMRFNDQFLLIYTYNINYAQNNEGVALTRNFQTPVIGGNPVFSKRDRLTLINRISANYIFTNRMGITFSLRHYWSEVTYNEFFLLNDLGQFYETSYTGLDDDLNSLHNSSFNAFTIDMVYRWVFAPGSELSFVWKNSIFNTSGEIANGYLNNLQNLTEFPATNSVSLKILYYLDFKEVKDRLF